MVNCARFTSFTLHSPLGSAGRTLPACSGKSSNFSCCSAIIVVAWSTPPALTLFPIFFHLLKGALLRYELRPTHHRRPRRHRPPSHHRLRCRPHSGHLYAHALPP